MVWSDNDMFKAASNAVKKKKKKTLKKCAQTKSGKSRDNFGKTQRNERYRRNNI